MRHAGHRDIRQRVAGRPAGQATAEQHGFCGIGLWMRRRCGRFLLCGNRHRGECTYDNGSGDQASHGDLLGSAAVLQRHAQEVHMTGQLRVFG
jgi:hypothetical protein